ncbi:histidine phosphatase family protein [Saccharospirillum impatiens]|uniref:histidine phosphatase family protein n=1 Tax=Saccharospirillum impatiens TaxID=169438 RepID=UPI0003FF9A0C|nr:histidine phosphatase family protein [Saccharospirillum impatiens]
MILIRHGAPAENGVCYGHSDPALAVPAEATARSLPPTLAEQAGAWYCSPSSRCLEVAQRLVPAKQLTTVDALRELNFGDWEQQPWSAIEHSALDAWAERPLDFRMPGGESARDLFNRVEAWATGAGIKEGDVIVAHAGSLRALAAVMLEQPFERTWQWPVPYGTALIINSRGTGFDLWDRDD